MANQWQSYDSAATVHDRLAVPGIFTPPARDLVASLDLPASGMILDVGTGTGVAALLAMQAASRATVVGLDPSVEMLGKARSRGLRCVVAGSVPGLPFPAAIFDRVLASFVLSHLASYQAALMDMTRVLRPGGKIGVTAWGPMRNQPRELWQSIADSFAGAETLRAAAKQALPWEESFEDPAHLQQAFEEARLENVTLRHTEYTTRMSIADFLEIRETGVQARFMRQTLDRERWERFKQTVSAEFRRAFPDPIEYTRDVHIAVGQLPNL